MPVKLKFQWHLENGKRKIKKKSQMKIWLRYFQKFTFNTFGYRIWPKSVKIRLNFVDGFAIVKLCLKTFQNFSQTNIFYLDTPFESVHSMIYLILMISPLFGPFQVF